MSWRRLHPGELDHELTWLLVSLGSVAVIGLWLYLGLPQPQCTFHKLTGFACPTCGATRCVRFLGHGAWSSAFLINPLIFSTFMSVLLYDIYAAMVLAFRLPRLRFDKVPGRTGNLVRFGVIAVLVINWAWLIWRGV